MVAALEYKGESSDRDRGKERENIHLNSHDVIVVCSLVVK